jgi:hypothetical protein
MTGQSRRALAQAIDTELRRRGRHLLSDSMLVLRETIAICTACGIDADLRTAGCHTCKTRHKSRRVRARRAAA